MGTEISGGCERGKNCTVIMKMMLHLSIVNGDDSDDWLMLLFECFN